MKIRFFKKVLEPNKVIAAEGNWFLIHIFFLYLQQEKIKSLITRYTSSVSYKITTLLLLNSRELFLNINSRILRPNKHLNLITSLRKSCVNVF